jgi:thiol-disulfide isomerase/thioredoxin
MLALVLLLSCFHAAVLGHESSEADAALLLTTDTFTSHLASSSPETGTIVFFFAPWCGHCQKFQSIFSEVAVELPPQAAKKVDAIAQASIAQKYQVTSFPTLIWFNGGDNPGTTTNTYLGAKDKDSIVSYYNQRSDPPVVVLTTASEIAALDTNTEVSIILNSANAKVIEAFASVAVKPVDSLIESATKSSTPAYGHLSGDLHQSDLCDNCIRTTIRTVSSSRKDSMGNWAVRTVASLPISISPGSKTLEADIQKAVATYVAANYSPKQPGMMPYVPGIINGAQKGGVIKRFVAYVEKEYKMEKAFGDVAEEIANR